MTFHGHTFLKSTSPGYIVGVAVPEAPNRNPPYLERGAGRLTCTKSFVCTTSDLRSVRKPPEESGPFGKKRVRYGPTRRMPVPPIRRDNPNVAEFTRLMQQHRDVRRKDTTDESSQNDSKKSSNEKVATECILYGYKNKDIEWKVIDKYERISGGLICEDYARTDPIASLAMSGSAGADVVIRTGLTPDANRKSKRYDGGSHWIKVTFETLPAAEQAISYSPQIIDGYKVYCDFYHGHGPKEDVPIPTEETRARLIAAAQAKGLAGNSTGAAFEIPAAEASGTTRNHPTSSPDEVNYPTIPTDTTSDNQSHLRPTQPHINSLFNRSLNWDRTQKAASTSTGSPHATATAASSSGNNDFRQRHAPHADASSKSNAGNAAPTADQKESGPSQNREGYSTIFPGARLATLRPVSDALPPTPSLKRRILQAIPGFGWLTGEVVGEGPALHEDGSFDYDKSNFYWQLVYSVDQCFGTDLCGMRD